MTNWKYSVFPGRVLYALLLLLLFTETLVAQDNQPSTLYPLEQYKNDPPERLQSKINLQTDAMPLEEVLREIGRQANLILVFNTDLAAAASPQPFALDNVDVIESLQTVLKDTGLQGYLMPDWKILITKAAEPQTQAPQTSQRQTIRGQVTDKDSQIPLPSANVIVLNSEPLIGTTTDMNGHFALPNVPLGRHDIQFSFIGYEAVILPEVLVSSGKEVILNVTLKEQILMGQEVVIRPTIQKDQPLNDLAMVSARSFTVEETRRYAGGFDDPARMASAFAGVTSGNIQDNTLTIRGNAPKGVQWRLEGVEIPNPNHFANLNVAGGGGLTLFSSQLLDNSDFFTSAFPSEYGNALAGVFDMNLRTGNPQTREHAFQVGVLGIDVASEGPFSKGKPSTYLFNYRYSTLGLLMPILPTDDVANYQDLSFKTAFPTKKAGRFEIWGLGGLDRQTRTSSKPDSTAWKYEVDRTNYDLKLDIGAFGLTHNLVLGKKSYLTSRAVFTINRTIWDDFRYDDDLVLQDNQSIHSTDSRFIINTSLNHKFSNRHVNRTGVVLQQLFYDLNIQASPFKDGNLMPVSRGKGNSTLFQVFTQSKLDLTSTLALNVGLHAQHFVLTGNTSVEPRAGLRWQVGEGQALSLGYGLHSQIEDLRIYFVEQGTTNPNRHLNFAKAHHGVLGYDRQLGSSARLKLEAYYQHLFDVPVIADSSYSMLNFEQDWAFNETLINEGTGQNYGVEATVERFLKNGYYFLFTGAFFKSRYKGGDRIDRPTRFDQGYALNALFGKEFIVGKRGNLLGINARTAYTGGKRYSPVDDLASQIQQEVVFDEYRAFEIQSPSTFIVDLTVTYRTNKLRYSGIWALQVKNLLAAKYYFLDYNYQTGRVEEANEGFPLPVLSYKIEF